MRIGHTVLVTSHQEFYHLVDYLRRTTSLPIGIAVGMPTVQELIDPRYYATLPGGVLAALGRLYSGPQNFMSTRVKTRKTPHS